MEISYFLLNDLPATRSNKHGNKAYSFGPMPIHFGKFTSRFSFASILQFALLHMLVSTCIVPYFYICTGLISYFKKFVSIGLD